MNYAIDWAHKTDGLVILNENEKQFKIENFEPDKEKDILLIETGFPKYKFFELCKNIFVISGKKVKAYNEENNIEKTHLNDAKAIMALYKKDKEQFKEFTEKDKTETELLQKYKLYEKLTKDITRMKNMNIAIKREYGVESENYQGAIKLLEKEKAHIISRLAKHFKEESKKLEHIKGVGNKIIVCQLLYAHPRKFPNITAYLRYSGCKSESFWKEVNGKRKKAG